MHGTLPALPPPRSAAAFYASPRGQTATAVLRDRLSAFWPDLSGQAVLGLGFAEPFLTLWQHHAYRCFAALPAELAPATTRQACLIEADRLPFPDLSFDRILLVHGVDGAADARRLLREVWRVLKDDGRILVVAPNRLGLWAHVESTPFGHGQPYSQMQMAQLLAASMFRPERRDAALFIPPVTSPSLLRGWPVWEQLGHKIAPRLAGVTLIEAVKDAYAGLTSNAAARRSVLLPEAVLTNPASVAHPFSPPGGAGKSG